MGRFYYQQNSFQSGQLSPVLYGRTDIEEYRKALRNCTNFRITDTGGVSKRNGFSFGSVLFGVTGAKVLMRYKDYRNDPVDRILNLYNIGSSSIGISIDNLQLSLIEASRFNVISSLSQSEIVQLISDAANLDPYGFHYVQINNYLIFTHSSGTMEPMIISPTVNEDFPNDTTYALSRFFSDYILSVGPNKAKIEPSSPFLIPHSWADPMDILNYTNLTLNSSSATALGSTTLTAKVGGTNEPFFTDEDIGSVFSIDDKNASPVRVCAVLVTATTGTKASPSATATGTVLTASSGFSTAADSDLWRESTFSNKNGWPLSVATFESRLVFGGSPSYPTKLWASNTTTKGNFNTLAWMENPVAATIFRAVPSPVNPSMPYSFELTSGGGEIISWVTATETLMVGTNKREIRLNGGDMPISASNFPRVETLGTLGSSAIQPIVIKNQVFSADRTGVDIVNIKYSGDVNSFISQRVSSLSDIFKTNQEIITRLHPIDSENIVLVETLSKKIYTFTVSQFSQDLGFTPWSYDTTSLTLHTLLPKEPSPNNPAGVEVAYGLVGAGTERLGFMPITNFPQEFLIISQAQFLDAYRTIQNDTDLDKLLIGSGPVGRVYTVLAPDGDYISSAVDADFKISLPKEYPLMTSFIVGFKYTARLETLDLAVGPNFLYSSAGDEFRIDTVHFDLFRTYDLEYGTVSDGEEILYPLEITTPPAVSGRFKVNLPMTSSNETRVVIQSSSPFNVTVSSMTMRGKNTQVS